MGDVLTLIEKAEAAVGEDEQAEMERRMRAGEFTFDDFLAELPDAASDGAGQGRAEAAPGRRAAARRARHRRDADGARRGDRALDDAARAPDARMLINGPRRRRIAAGSGTSIDEVNKLLAARKQMQKMMKQFGKGKLPTLPPELTGGKPRR